MFGDICILIPCVVSVSPTPPSRSTTPLRSTSAPVRCTRKYLRNKGHILIHPTGKIEDFIRFDTGVIAMATGGRNMGRVGVITHRERHDGGFNIVHIKDAIDNEFATRESNVFVIGQEKPWISLPKGKGVKLSIAEERDRRRAYALAGQ
jgi:hypothetical protein